MNHGPAWHDLEQLAAESGWARALARRLIADQNAADDVSQEALLATIGSPVRSTAWIGGVVRNLAASWRRREGRRRRREAATARPEAQPSTVVLAERLEQQRLLAAAVLALDERYRSAILLRFFEGLSQREIARREGVPSTTVNSRLTRALAKLREHLDREHKGSRDAWVAAFLPLTQSSLPAGLVTLGALMMKQKLIAGVVLIAVVAGATWVGWQPREPKTAAQEAVLPAAAPVARVEGRAPIDAGEAKIDRTPVATTRTPPAAGETVQVLVRDANGDAVAGAQVLVFDVARIAFDPVYRRQYGLRERSAANPLDLASMFADAYLADADGRAFVARPMTFNAQVWAHRDDQMSEVAKLPMTAASSIELHLEAIRHVSVRVVDELDRPMAGVPVWLRRQLSGSWMPISRAPSDREGIASITYWREARLDVGREHLDVALDIPLAEPRMSAVFDPIHWPVDPIKLVCPSVGSVVARVVGPDDAPMPDETLVYLTSKTGPPWTELLRDGKATFWPVGLGLEIDVGAGLRWDQSPICEHARGPRVASEVVTITVQLEGRLCEITGRILDAAGEPMRAGQWSLVCDDRHSTQCATDSEGHFHATFTEPRAHPLSGRARLQRLFGGSDRTCVTFDLPPVPESGRLDVGDLSCVPLVSGVVVDEQGKAVPGAWVSLDGASRSTRGASEQWPTSGTTDDAGRFALWGDRLPAGELTISASSGDVTWHHEPVPLVTRYDVRLVITHAGALTGRLLTDANVPPSSLSVSAWAGEHDARREWRGHRDFFASVDPSGAFRFAALAAGDYTVAVGVGIDPTSVVQIDHVSFDGHVTRDARLDPIDLRGKYRSVDLRVTNERGASIKASAIALYEGNDQAPFMNLERPMILAATATLITIVVHADGFFAQSLGPVDGTRDVVLSEGLPVPFEWDNAEPPGAPFFVRITLTPTEEPAAMPGGKRAASLVRRFSPSQADFATGRSVTLRVPAPGTYQVRCEAGVLESPYQDIKSLAELGVIAVDTTPRTQRVAVDARRLSAAWEELRAFQEKHKR